MSHVLRRPWNDENPADLSKTVLVERLAFDDRGRLTLLGREVLADGTKGRVRAWTATPFHIASMLYALAVGYRGIYWARRFPRDAADLWQQLKARIDEERDQMRKEGQR